MATVVGLPVAIVALVVTIASSDGNTIPPPVSGSAVAGPPAQPPVNPTSETAKSSSPSLPSTSNPPTPAPTSDVYRPPVYLSSQRNLTGCCTNSPKNDYI